MKVAAAVVLLATAMIMQADAQSTPAEYCAVCADHTMCKYPGIACTTYTTRVVTAADIVVILDEHNKKRNTVALGLETRGTPGPQPKASNMRKLVWNQQLADVAQRWADQCQYGHDTCRRITPYAVGQNVAQQSSTAVVSTTDFVWAITAWYDEVTMYSNANINPFSFASATGHYTQVVWANTFEVGCGVVFYKSTPTDVWNHRYYVCNYGSAGNFIGQALYSTGEPATACPTGTIKDTVYPGLCANASITVTPTTTTTTTTTTAATPTTTTTTAATPTTTTTTVATPTTTTTRAATPTTTTTTVATPTTTTTRAATPTTTTTTAATPTTATTRATTTTTTTRPTTATTTVFTTTSASTAGYCGLCADHTMCKYTKDGPGPACVVPLNRTVSGLTDRNLIVTVHNSARNRVAKGQETRGAPGPQPPAANMRKMSWDAELATFAQRWADQCTNSTDTCRRSARFDVGQNMQMANLSSTATPLDFWRMVDNWYLEAATFNRAGVASFSSNGRYPQLVNANTYLVGCGWSVYKTSSADTRKYVLYVCYYGPSGVVGTPLYTVGTACSRCPAGTTCDTSYSGLCK